MLQLNLAQPNEWIFKKLINKRNSSAFSVPFTPWLCFVIDFFFYLFHLKKTGFTLEMLTHARLSKVLACVALKKRRSFLLFFLAVPGFGIISLDSGRDFQQSLPRSWSWCILFVFYASVLPVLLWDVEDSWSKGGFVFGKVERVRRGTENK